MVMQRAWDNSRDEEYWYDDGLPEEPVYEVPADTRSFYDTQIEGPGFAQSPVSGATDPQLSAIDSFYSPGGYTREQEAYMQTIRDAASRLAERYPGAALNLPWFMNETYNTASEDPNAPEIDTWTPHYAPGSEIDAAMASGKTPEEMIKILGYGAVNPGDVKAGGMYTGRGATPYQYLMPGQTYTLVDNVSGKSIMSATTPEELRDLTWQANNMSGHRGNKADWSIVSDYGTDAQKTVASDFRDPDDVNLDWLYGLLAAAAAVAAPYALGAFSGLGAAGAAGTAAGTAAGAGLSTLPPATLAALLAAPLPTLPAATLGTSLGAGLATVAPITVVSTAPAVGGGLGLGSLAAGAAGAGALASGLSSLGGSTTPASSSVTDLPIEEAQVNVNPVPDLPYDIPLPSLPLPTLPTVSPTGGPTEELPVEETQVDAEPIPRPPYEITPVPIPTTIPTGPIADTLPTLPDTAPPGTSPDYLGYVRTALTLASLLGGGGGSRGGATGTVPGGGGGLMPPNFKTDTLPTGEDIPPFGGGTSPTARAPRDMGDIDWKRYGFGPERSFFMNVPQRFAAGGSMAVKRSPLTVRGPGDGRSDDIPAVLSDGEYVMDAETVALLGNGSNKAGAAKLDRFRANVRKHKGKELAKGRFSANAKNPQAYMAGGRS